MPGGSKLPPNLDIDNQPVSGVRKPYQQQQPQQPPMAQPLNMAQVPPMANPPIKEQPVYQPFTPPQAPPSNGNFSSGLVWAILTLIFCCNPLSITSVVLSAIATGEFKSGDLESAQKHAKLSKIITIIAIALSILSAIAFSMIPVDETTEESDDAPTEEVEQIDIETE